MAEMDPASARDRRRGARVVRASAIERQAPGFGRSHHGRRHRLTIEQAPDAHKTFRDQQDGCIKMVLRGST